MWLFLCIAVVLILPDPAAGAQTVEDWRQDWSVRRGYSVRLDSQGYDLPTAIAFVPKPGSGSKDPLYFVTQLRGIIKVVTNDRTVFTFARVLQRRRPIPAFGAADSMEVGVTGICVEPERGYVFVTFAYQDAAGVLRNNIVRFQSRPGTFSLTPTGRSEFGRILASDQAIPSHQIGSCQVHLGQLYVSVGDGGQPHRSRRVDSTLGKVLRMDLDGNPVAGNPFSTPPTDRGANRFVWARGFRNPFGLKIVNGQVFVADNGLMIDRVVRVRRGGDYLWSGSDRGIGTNAVAVISPGRGVTQIEYRPRPLGTFPEGFFVNVSGAPIALDRTLPPHILHIGYSAKDERVASAPQPFLKYRGKTVQVLAGLAFGPDGLYFAPLLPNAQGVSAIFKIAYAPGERYPLVLEDERDPQLLLAEKGCLTCHEDPQHAIGPTLNAGSLVPRLMNRLHSKEYTATVARLDDNAQEPFVSFRGARRKVLAAEGLDRVTLWLTYRIMEPRFDRTVAIMPNMGVSEPDATVIADFLVSGFLEQQRQQRSVAFVLRRLLPARPRLRHLVVIFASGFAAGAALLTSGFVLARRAKMKRKRIART